LPAILTGKEAVKLYDYKISTSDCYPHNITRKDNPMYKVVHTNEAQYSLFDISELPITPLPNKKKHPHDLRKEQKRNIISTYLTKYKANK
jgi:hypothetical protein